MDGAPVEQLLGPIRWRPLVDGVRDTVAHTRRAVQAGRIDIDRAIA